MICFGTNTDQLLNAFSFVAVCLSCVWGVPARAVAFLCVCRARKLPFAQRLINFCGGRDDSNHCDTSHIKVFKMPTVICALGCDRTHTHTHATHKTHKRDRECDLPARVEWKIIVKCKLGCGRVDDAKHWLMSFTTTQNAALNSKQTSEQCRSRTQIKRRK